VLETKINSIQKPNGRATKPPRNLLIWMDTAPRMDWRLRMATTAKHVMLLHEFQQRVECAVGRCSS
jgi:hypothetical protein